MKDVIFEQKLYRRQTKGANGEPQVQRVRCLENIKTGERKFVGSVTVNIKMGMGQGQNKQAEVNFEIDADDIEDAFDKFQERAHEALEEQKEKLRAQAQQQQLSGPQVPGNDNVDEFSASS